MAVSSQYASAGFCVYPQRFPIFLQNKVFIFEADKSVSKKKALQMHEQNTKHRNDTLWNCFAINARGQKNSNKNNQEKLERYFFYSVHV